MLKFFREDRKKRVDKKEEKISERKERLRKRVF
jgi:hypothetical protein